MARNSLCTSLPHDESKSLLSEAVHPVKLVRKIEDIDDSFSGCALTIGNFDGVHRGHAAIIDRLNRLAQQFDGPSVVLTFDPHPVRLLRPDLAPPPLTWTARKAELLGFLNVDRMIAWPTSRDLLSLSYVEFFEQVIVGKLKASAMVEGPNFFFGKDREGDVERLGHLCNTHSIACEIVQPNVCGDELISSTRIRSLVKEGDVAAAAQMLTEPYRIRGMVVHGAGRGAGIGFPTANLDAIDTMIPAMGIYAGLANVGNERLLAAIHIGPSPTFGVERPTVEVFLLDFSRSIYGEVIEVDFLERLRGVENFDSVTALQDQMTLDVQRARTIAGNWLSQSSMKDR